MPVEKTRQKRDPEASRDRLFSAGVRLFSERGYDGVSVSMLADATRLNRRMLYHYFGSKDGLYRSVVQYAYERLASLDVEPNHLLLPPEELVAEMVRAYYSFLAEHPEIVRLVAWENLREGKTAKTLRLDAQSTPILAALQFALERGKREGRFRKDVDEKQLLISCLALSFYYFSNQHTVGQWLGVDLASEEAIERRVEHVVALLLDGIRAGNGKSRSARPVRERAAR